MNDYLTKPSTHTIGIEKELSHPVLIVSTVVLLGARLCCISKEKKMVLGCEVHLFYS